MEDVVDDNNEVYVYGDLYATTSLLKKTNSKSITTYTDGNTHEMYTFEHVATEQTPSLTDYRYIGNDPYNYVKFNGDETWRIIGVFDVEDGEGNWDTRIKLIRNESLGNMSWNSVINSEWIGSSLQLYLNDFYNLTSSFDLVSNSIYYLGGRSDAMANSEQSYISERSLDVYSNNSTKWLGLVGLLYPSDYIFTYSKSIDDVCYSTPRKCSTDNGGNPHLGWIYSSEYSQWTITPSSSSERYAFYIIKNGNYGYGSHVANVMGVRPTIYLKPNVKIKSGDGTIDNPYEFEL